MVRYSSTTFKITITAPHILASIVVMRLLTSEPITSLRLVNIISVMTGSGSTKLSTTWLITSVSVGLTPSNTTMNTGNIVTNRRIHTGMVKPTNPCMMTCPAIVPTLELERPEASSDTAKTTLAAPPNRGVSVLYALLISAMPVKP